MTKRTRTIWDEILPAWDHAHRAANAGRATLHQRAVLEAVLWLLGSFQRLDDTIRLTQVAQHAGLWDGEGECPRSASAAAGRHLQALADLGAITYQPSKSRHGCKVGLIQPDDGTRAGARELADPRTRAGTRESRPARAPERASGHNGTRAKNGRLARPAPSGRASEAPGSRATARASEGFPRVTEENPRGAAFDDSASGSVDGGRPMVIEVGAADPMPDPTSYPLGTVARVSPTETYIATPDGWDWIDPKEAARP